MNKSASDGGRRYIYSARRATSCHTSCPPFRSPYHQRESSSNDTRASYCGCQALARYRKHSQSNPSIIQSDHVIYRQVILRHLQH